MNRVGSSKANNNNIVAFLVKHRPFKRKEALANEGLLFLWCLEFLAQEEVEGIDGSYAIVVGGKELI